MWSTQQRRVECWLEKDALSGIFEDALNAYGVTLNVGRGFDGWSSIHEAGRRLGEGDAILYFGDFDPSGEDILRDFRERSDVFDEVEHVAVQEPQIAEFSLTRNPGKWTDSRAQRFFT